MQKANSDTTCKILAGFMRQKLKKHTNACWFIFSTLSIKHVFPLLID